MRDRLFQLWSDYKEDAFLAFGVGLVAFTAFGLGRATAPMPPKSQVTVEPLPLAASAGESAVPTEPIVNAAGSLVASKNGTKYYLPSCSGANRIKDENRIWFATAEEARENGYEPAANCPGLQKK